MYCTTEIRLGNVMERRICAFCQRQRARARHCDETMKIIESFSKPISRLHEDDSLEHTRTHIFNEDRSTPVSHRGAESIDFPIEELLDELHLRLNVANDSDSMRLRTSMHAAFNISLRISSTRSTTAVESTPTIHPSAST